MYFFVAKHNIVGIQPNVFFTTLEKPVLIYKKRSFGEDCIDHFIKYDTDFESEAGRIIESINPYLVKENDANIDVIADWLFSTNYAYLHIEVDNGNEQIRKSKNIHNDTSFENKLSRLHYQLEKQKINAENYHVLFVMIDNRKDAVLTQLHPSRSTRIANVKQEIPRFSEYNQWQFDMHVIPFSRANDFLRNFIRKFSEPNQPESEQLDRLIDAFMRKTELQFSDWSFGCLKKDFLNKFPTDGYVPTEALVYENEKKNQVLIPFFLKEGDVKLGEQLSILAEGINRGKYINCFTKILVIYPSNDQLNHDILRKNKANSKDFFAMDTSKMIFVSLENITNRWDTPKLFNARKKLIPYNDILVD